MALDALAIGVSGVRAASLRQANSAHNIANLLTEDFQARRTHQVESRGGGVDAFTRVELEPVVDVAREFVDQPVAKFQLQASVRAIEADLDAKGSVLDILV